MYFSVPLKIPVVLAGIMVLVSCYLVLAPIIDQPELEYLYCTIFIFSGLILYYPFVYRKVNWGRKIMSKFIFLTVKILNIYVEKYVELYDQILIWNDDYLSACVDLTSNFCFLIGPITMHLQLLMDVAPPEKTEWEGITRFGVYGVMKNALSSFGNRKCA